MLAARPQGMIIGCAPSPALPDLHPDLRLAGPARRRGYPSKIEGVSDPADPDRELNENGALLPGSGAILTGPTFQEWLHSAP